MPADALSMTAAPPDPAARATPAPEARQLDTFLRGIEGRALRMAEFACGHREDALEIVQEAMCGLARRYADRPPADWPPLFWRVLDSRIRDHLRRARVRARWLDWLKRDPDAADDPVANLADAVEPGPWQRLADGQTRSAVDAALAALPLRQRQVFLLRVWEGLDVATTARALGIGEGSVKTHLSRALAHLRARLEAHR